MSLDSFQLNAKEFVADVANAVSQYCADGFDHFDRCLCEASTNPEVTSRILQGTDLLHTSLSSAAKRQMDLFEQICMSAVFSIPATLLLPKNSTLLPETSYSEEEEQLLQSQLTTLQSELEQVISSCRMMEAETKLLDHQIAEYGDASSFTAMSAAACSNMDSVIAQVTAVTQAAAKMQPLLDRAAELRLHREPQGQNPDMLAADWQLKQQMHKVGSLQDIQLLQQML